MYLVAMKFHEFRSLGPDEKNMEILRLNFRFLYLTDFIFALKDASDSDPTNRGVLKPKKLLEYCNGQGEYFYP